MPLIKTTCILSGCRETVYRKGRCYAHQLPSYQSNRKERLPANWSELRRAVLNRDNFICQICGGPNADTVDHIMAGDDHSMENLQSVHDRLPPHCHRYKTSQEANDAKRKQQMAQWGRTWQEEYERRQRMTDND